MEFDQFFNFLIRWNKKMIKNSILLAILSYFLSVLFYAFDPMLQTFPSVLTDQFMKSFATNSFGVSLIASSYFYLYNFFQIPMGFFIDFIGYKKIFLISCVLCSLGIVLFYFSKTLQMAIFSRIIMGFGASSAAALMVVITVNSFDRRYIPVLMGLAQMIGNIGSIFGQYPFNALNELIGWRSSILLISVFPLLLFFLSFKIFSEKAIKNRITIKNQIKDVFFNIKNWIIAVYGMLIWTPFYIFSSLWGVPYLRESYGYNISTASALIAVAWLGSSIGSFLFGFLSSIFNKTKIFIVISSMIGVIFFPILLIFKITNIVFLIFIIFSFGLSSSGQALTFSMMNENNNIKNIGLASGFNNTVIMMGGMFIDPLVGWLINLNFKGSILDGVPQYSILDYKRSLSLLFIMLLLSLSISLFYKDSIKIPSSS